MEQIFRYDNDDIKLMQYADSVIEHLLNISKIQQAERIRRLDDVTKEEYDFADWELGGKFTYYDENTKETIRLAISFTYEVEEDYHGGHYFYGTIDLKYISPECVLKSDTTLFRRPYTQFYRYVKECLRHIEKQLEAKQIKYDKDKSLITYLSSVMCD